MRRALLTSALGGLLLGLAGCGGDQPATKPLTAEEEKQFEEQRQKARQTERRTPNDG